MNLTFARFSTLAGSAALALGVLAFSTAPLMASAVGGPPPPPPPASITIDTINGDVPGGHCIAGTLTLVVHGTSGPQGGPYSIDVGNGFSTTTASDVVVGGSTDFSNVTITYTPQESSTALYVFLYHGSPTGNDSHFTSVTQCVAPPTQGVVIVEKHVVNDNGGLAAPGDFTLHIGDNDFAGELAGTDNLLTAGSYTLSEDAVAGYAGTIGGDCAANGAITVIAGENYLCTITNDDMAIVQPKLTVTKVVVNDNGGTKVIADFPLFVDTTGVTSGAQNEFGVGAHTVSETTDSAYTSAITGDCAADGSITLAPGDVKSCTITNDDKPGTLTVIKEVVNDAGGTADASEWTMNVTATNPSDASFPGAANPGTTITLDAGTYSVAEAGGPAGYSQTGAFDCSGTIAAGESKTCTITNDDIAPLFMLTKVVTNDDRGDSSVEDFSLFANLTALVSGVQAALTAGIDYAITEEGPGGYNASFSGDCDTDGHITLGLGDVKNCTLTNDDKDPGTLTIIKHVENDNPEDFRGTAVASDFTLSITGGHPDPSSVEGSEEGVEVVIDGDADYSVAETDGPTGYGVSYSAGCSGTMPEGGSPTCTVTNNDTPADKGYLTVNKTVVNDNGGTAEASAWTLQITDSSLVTTSVTNGDANLLIPGTYEVSETGGPDGYTKTSTLCSTDGAGAVETSSITVEAGHSYVCTITNDDVAPSLTLVKEASNDDGGDAVATDWTLGAIGPSTISGEGGATSDETFVAGTYTLSESEDGPAGYTAGDWSCTNAVVVGEGNEITLDLGESTICTIENDDIAPQLTIIKHVVNDNGGELGADDFTMHVSGTDVSDDSFAGSEDGTVVTLDAGTYEVTEDAVEGYGASLGEDCSGTIGVGEHKVCTVTNDDGMATLTIVKHASGAEGTFIFGVTGHEDVSITTAEGSGSATLALNGGTYDVVETVPAGWSFAGVSCVYDEESVGVAIVNGETITIHPGDDVTCTFNNRATGADLSLTKSVDDETPDAGQTITYSLTAANAGPATATGITVHDVLPAGLTYVSDDGAGAYATSTGDWTIPTLASASSTALHITATVTAAAGETVINVGTISLADEGVSDDNPTNDSGEVSFTVNTPGTPPAPDEGRSGGSGGRAAPRGQVLAAATSTPPQLGVTCGLYMDQHLMQGSPKNKPDQVTKLQQFLLKYDFGRFTPTGIFGPLTFNAVKAFQLANKETILQPWGLTSPTGLAYLTTIRELNLIECPELMLPMPELVPWNQNPHAQ